MRSITEPLNSLQAAGARFARDHEVRLLVVRIAGELRGPVLQLLPCFEFHADNFSPWIVLADARTAADDGWPTRTNRLVDHWEQRRRAFAETGVELPPLSVRAVAEGSGRGLWLAKLLSPRFSSRLEPFKATAAAVLEALPEPQQGLVLILAPAATDDHRALEAELTALVIAPELAGARFVLVLSEDEPRPERLLDALGTKALSCDCTIDPARKEQDCAALLAGGAGITGPCGVTPPLRPGSESANFGPDPKNPLKSLEEGVRGRSFSPEPHMPATSAVVSLRGRPLRGRHPVPMKKTAWLDRVVSRLGDPRRSRAFAKTARP